MLIIDSSIMSLIEANIREELKTLQDISLSLKECAKKSALVGDTYTKARAEVAVEYTSLVEELQLHFNELSSYYSLIESYMHAGPSAGYQEDSI